MNLQAEKIELAKMLLETDDQSLLKDIRSIFTRKKEAIKIPQHVMEGIRESQEQLKQGKGIPYSEIKKELGI